MALQLIVAVEPDAAQAKQLSSMAKRYLRVEFVFAATATAALKTLGDRVPDLILTPVLLPTKDEVLLTEHLRQLGATASHVQTLAIPILSASEPSMRERGSRLIRRRPRPDSGDSGCDVAVFADQVKIYLERAAAEQRARADATVSTQPASAHTPAVSDTTEELMASAVIEAAATPDAELPLVDVPAPAPTAPTPRRIQARESRPLTPPDPTRARDLEVELGLVPTPGHAPHLWRVTTGLVDETQIVEEPASVTAADPPRQEVDSPAPAPLPIVPDAAPTPIRKRGRTNRPSPPPDDWQYFDPTQNGFKALIRRLDEIAAHCAAAEAMADGSGPSEMRRSFMNHTR